MFPRCSCLPEPPRSCFMSAFEFSGTVYQGKSCQGFLLRREKSKHRRTSSFFAFILFFHRPHFLLQGSSKPIPYQAVAFFTFDFLLSKIKIKLMKIYSNLCCYYDYDTWDITWSLIESIEFISNWKKIMQLYN